MARKLYSKRKQVPPSNYCYNFPVIVRKRILHAIAGLNDYNGCRSMMFVVVERRLLVEYGELCMANSPECFEDTPFLTHVLSCSDDQFLDFLELVFQTPCQCEQQDGVNAINEVLRDAAIGYELSPFGVTEEFGNNGPMAGGIGLLYDFPEIVVKTSELLHSEVVEPTLQLLTDSTYRGANEEYLRAHEYYRKGDNIGCLNECLKAFESTMKIICHAKGWSYDQRDAASKLIQICLDNGLLPKYSQEHLTSLRKMLAGTIPTARNRQTGHGQGVNQNVVPDSMASFILHTTAATILLLTTAAKE